MLTALPPELLDGIADNLHPLRWHRASNVPAKGDLEAFSLVCRRFRSIGQSHLFRDVVCSFRCTPAETQGGSVPSTQPLDDQWANHPDYPRRTLHMLWSFFQNQPSLGSAVRRLRLVAYPGNEDDIVEYDTGDIVEFRDSDYTETSLFHQLLALLPLLEELELADIELLSSRAYWTSHVAPLPSLRRLLIEYPYRSNQSDTRVAEILGCFDSVDEVLVSNVELDDAAPYESISPSSIRIRSFVLFDQTFISGALFNFLLRSPSSCTLRRLDTAFVTPTTNASVELQRLIQSVGPHLEHFGCNVTERWDLREPGFRVTDLSVCSSLRSLTLRIYPWDTLPNSEVWERCTQTIEACQTSALLRTITFGIFMSLPGFDQWLFNLSYSVRRTEGALLDHARRGSLSFVRFVTPDQASPLKSSSIEQLTNSFPRLAEKRMLVFV